MNNGDIHKIASWVDAEMLENHIISARLGNHCMFHKDFMRVPDSDDIYININNICSIERITICS